MVEQKLPKLTTGVRFPSPAPVPVLPPVSFLQQCTCLGSRHAVQIHHKKTNQCSLLENIKLLTVLILQNFFTLQFTLQMQRIIQRSNWTLGPPRSRNLKDWNRGFEKHISFVAIDDRTIVGFGDIEENGYLDRLFVRPDYQRMGIGTAICNKLEGAVQGNVFTHASITAKPFFEKRGYKVIKGQTVKRRGVLLTNFVMEYRR